MSNPSNRASMRGQLTLRGVVIGVLGCVIITASSAYTAPFWWSPRIFSFTASIHIAQSMHTETRRPAWRGLIRAVQGNSRCPHGG